MKKNNVFISIIAAAMLLFGIGASAQTQVGTSADLLAAVAAMQTTGGTIQLTGPITVSNADLSDPNAVVSATYTLTLSASSPITIDCGANIITVTGTGTTTSSIIFSVGNNVTITGSGASTITSTANGRINVTNGGKVINTATTSGKAVNAFSGWAIVDAGAYIETQSPNGIALESYNSFTNLITGGTFVASADGAIALSCSGTPGTNNPIANATLIANGKGAIAARSQNGWKLTLTNCTVQTSSTDNTDIALKGEGTGYVVLTSGSLTSTNPNPYNAAATSAALDLTKTINITANPASGYTFVNPGPVTLTVAYTSGASVAGNIYYNYGSAPTGTSAYVANGATVPINSSTTLYANVMTPDGAYSFSPASSFTYTVTNPSGPKLIGSQADLDAAIAAYNADPAGSNPQWQFIADFSVNENLTFSPSATYPVSIDCNGKTISFAGAFTYNIGGALTMNSNILPSTYSSLLRLIGVAKLNITGGTYSINAGSGNGNVIVSPSGLGAGFGTQLNMSNATFTITGTATTRILQTTTADIGVVTANNCIFNVTGGTGAIAFDLNGPCYGTTPTNNVVFEIKNSTMTINGGGKAFNQNPNKVGSAPLVIDGLNLTTTNTAGIFNWNNGAALNYNASVAVKNMTVNGSISDLTKPALPATPGTGVLKFYDYRGYASPVVIAANPAPSGIYTAATVPPSVSFSSGITPKPYDAEVGFIYTTDGSVPTITNGTLIPVSGTVAPTLDVPIKIAAVYYDYATATNVVLANSVATFLYPSVISNVSDENISEKQIFINGNTMYLPKTGNVQIYNVSGQMLLNTVTTDKAIDLSSFMQGIYIVKIGKSIYKVIK